MKRFKVASIFLLTVLLLSNSAFSQEHCFDLIPNKSPEEIRILKILITADQEYKAEIIDWKEEITKIVATASMLLNVQKIGIELKIVKFTDWQRGTKDDGKENELSVISELSKDFPRDKKVNFDIVLGLTTHSLQNSQGYTDTHYGCILLSNQLVEKPISSSDRPKLFIPTLLHELGHIFGIWHVDDEKSVMKKTTILIPGKPTPVLYDQKSLKKVKINKWRKIPSKVNWKIYLLS